jgi:predicted MPP superfamily phosphohydrolase
MDTKQFIPYLILMASILLLMDYLVVRAWAKYINKWNKNINYSKAGWILFGIMFVLSAIGLYLRSINNVPNEFIKVIYIVTAIWYLPKLVIAPVLLLNKSVQFSKKIFQKIRKNNLIDDKTPTFIEPLNDNRRKFIETAGWAMAGVPFLMVGNGMLTTTNNLEIKYIEIPMKNLPFHLDGLKIAQVSDIHAGSFYSPKLFKDTVYLINSHKPDFVMLTGDFVNFNPNELPLILNDIKRIESTFGTFGCLGNHDHYMNSEEHTFLIKSLKEANIDLLINENRIVKVMGAKIQVAGSDNTGYKTNFADFDKTFAGLDKNDTTILLCHDPMNWRKSIIGKYNADLTLSGHTHGGQVAIELFGETYTPAKYTYDEWAGLYSSKEQYLYVNRGLGTTGTPVRIGVKPELTIITLRAPSNLA